MAERLRVGRREQGVSPGSRARPSAAANGGEELAGLESGDGGGERARPWGAGESYHQRLSGCSRESLPLGLASQVGLKSLGEVEGGGLGRCEGPGVERMGAPLVGGLG